MLATLDATKPQKVTYCIDLRLRDEQIRHAIKRPIPRIGPGATEKRTEPIAVVGFGPSLQETWTELGRFSHVISCSGAHRFLLERGIVPTWHVEVDPRPHKIALLGDPHPGVTYLVASTCHPSYFDHLLAAGAAVQLWHVFDNAEEGLRLLPHDEWAITGGCSVGLRAMAMARYFGFTDLHVFGMDGSAKAADSHAAAHPNAPPAYQPCEYGGTVYQTTAGMLETARQTWHELDQMGDVTATFYGDGLVQAMAKDYIPKGKKGAFLAIVKPALISSDYAALNRQLHTDNLAYGIGGGRHAPTVLALAEKLKTASILDYGCGKGYLAKAIPYPIWEYDPAVPGKDESPRPADLVVSTDVLEHVEPDRLTYVLADLARCVRKVGFFVIHTGPAQKTLADGRNAHLIQRGEAWWRKRLAQHFTVGSLKKVGVELYAVVAPKGKG